MSDYLPLGISVNTQCLACFQIERLCDEHADAQEAQDSIRAQALVDDNELQYKGVASWLKDEPSGHDWVSSTTRVKPYFVWSQQEWFDTRDEYLEPTTNLSDRLFTEMQELGHDERVCDSCHYVCLLSAVCPNCN